MTKFDTRIKQYVNQHWLELVLNQHFNRLALDDSEKPSDTLFHPSQAGNCPRALWYSLSGFKSAPTSAITQRNFAIGRLYITYLKVYYRKRVYFVKQNRYIN